MIATLSNRALLVQLEFYQGKVNMVMLRVMLTCRKMIWEVVYEQMLLTDAIPLQCHVGSFYSKPCKPVPFKPDGSCMSCERAVCGTPLN